MGLRPPAPTQQRLRTGSSSFVTSVDALFGFDPVRERAEARVRSFRTPPRFERLHRLTLALPRDADVDERLGDLRRYALELCDRAVEVAVDEIDHREVVRELVGPDARIDVARGGQVLARLRTLTA